MESGESGALSAAQRRAEIRRRKLLMNSEDRMNRIVGFTKIESENNAGTLLRPAEPHFHLDLDRTEPWSSSSSSQRPSPFPPEASGLGSRSHGATPERRGSPLLGCSEPPGGSLEDDTGGIRQRPRGERAPDDLGGAPRQGLQKYLSRFDDAMKLRGQLANEKPAEDGASEAEEFDPFRIFRIIGSILLAVFVRGFVCRFLSIFAPFLTLELAYMGLSKYFPKVGSDSAQNQLKSCRFTGNSFSSDSSRDQPTVDRPSKRDGEPEPGLRVADCQTCAAEK